MALSNYSDLKDTIADYIYRPNDPSVPLASFIALAEGDINPRIMHYALEVEAALTAPDNTLALPVDFNEARRVIIDGVLAKPISPYGAELAADEIGYFQSGSSYVIAPAQSEPRNVVLTYYRRVPALSETATTNWLLATFPAVYLAASLVRAFRWTRDAEGEAQAKADLAEAFGLLQTDHARAVHSGNPITMETSSW